MKTYKGFDRNLKCRDFQYEVGKEYEMPDDDIKVCERGFHACESPLEVLDHYFFDDNAQMCRFAEVEQSGKIDRENGSTKVCSSKIKIKAELKFGDLIKAGIEWLKEVTRPGKADNSRLNDKGGDSAKIGSSGYYAKIGSSGYSAKIGSSGYYAQIGSSGDYAKIDSEGEDAVICCAGHGSCVRAKLGSWITLAEWVYDDKKGRAVPKKVETIQIDGKKYLPDTWYCMKDGEIIKVND